MRPLPPCSLKSAPDLVDREHVAANGQRATALQRRGATDGSGAPSLHQERFHALVRNSSDIITVLDAEGKVAYSSPAAQRVLGYPEGYMYGLSAFDLVHPDDVEHVVAAFVAGLTTHGPIEPVALRMRHMDGSWRHVEAVGNNMLDDPAVRGIVVNSRDVTERRVAEEALRESEERYRRLVEHSPHAIAVHQGGRFTYLNPASVQLIGAASEADLLGRPVLDIVHPEDRELVAARLARLEAGEQIELQEERLMRFDGSVVEAEVLAVPFTLAGERAIQVIASDITARKAAERALAHQALHDHLTGLPNRTLLLDRLGQAVARVGRTGAMVAVLFLDLDRFKVVNDSLGHDVGDRLLVSVASRMRDALRPSDTVARFGGDEFVILLEDSDDGEPGLVADRIADALWHPVRVDAEELRVRASIGIVCTRDASTLPVDLIRDADAAMYRAKDRGRGRYEIFDDEMRSRALFRLQDENALQRALERGELTVHYQPVIRVADGSVAGVEALVRWDHPERGVVLPGEFIPLAEESGLVVPMGSWVLSQACLQVKAWNDLRPEAEPIQVAVNLSARQLAQPDLPLVVSEVLREASATAALPFLCLEITESVFVEDALGTTSTLEALRDLGVRLAIDDFGTGYSSLAYLRRFPVDILKIDRAFLSELARGREESSAIVASVVQLAHALDLEVVAEGVETTEQFDVLASLGCDLVQGYLFARPQPPDAIAAILRCPPAWPQPVPSLRSHPG